MIGCHCKTCTSTDPRDTRFRSSVWIQAPDLQWVVDTGPDFRSQCLRAKITHLDAALYTHPHMDHLCGFDELRRFTIPQNSEIPIYGLPSTLHVISRMFDYAFNGQNRYPGYLKPNPQPITAPFSLGITHITPLPVLHGKVECIGYLFTVNHKKLCAYIPDCKIIPPETQALLSDLDTLIIDGLRHTPHPTHLTQAEAIDLSWQIKPRQTYLTHLQCEIHHATTSANLPPSFLLAYDTLRLKWEI
jgi:phosphoribosyl 1,2-cyclic phosphate phosphodiesterase